MTLAEKQELIKSATTEEELEARMAEIEADKEDEKEDVVEEETKKENSGEITPEEERKLLKDIDNLEERSVNVETKKIERKGDFKMEEFRNSKEYIDAYAEFLKTGDSKELRALVTTNGYATGNSATVEVPDMVYDIVKTAWEREEIMRLVRTISVKGNNMQVQFEVSADGATVHQEGNGSVNEEGLILGIVSLPAKSIKKWISISDEVVDLRGEAFLRYIYDELTYRIAKKCADELVDLISKLPQTLQANEDGIYDTVSADKITGAPAMGLVAESIGHLSDETRDITVTMNKLTYADFKAIQYAGNYAIDPFEGARVVFNNSLPAYSNAEAGQVYMIVGDYDHGALANYPVGDGIDIKFDDTTLMTADLVRILGRKFVGMNAVADKAFTLVAKAGGSI